MAQPSPAADLAAFRRFNRYYTRRTGVLSERYLDQNRPAGQSRLLYEIGAGTNAGIGVAELRQRLGLDAGQLSRMLAALERDGLLRLRPDPADGRRRLAELTEAGRREWEAQERRSDEAVARLLTGLGARRRAKLLDALTTAERLLHAAAVTIAPADPASPDARHCLLAYAAELRERFPEGYDDAELVSPADLAPPAGVLLLARDQDGDGDRPAGCGALRPFAPGTAELRHLWIAPGARGLGLGRRLLAALEAEAAARGHHTVLLNTHRALTEAIALYRAAGYAGIPAYSDDPHGQLCFEKRLRGPRPEPEDGGHEGRERAARDV
ncbi:GNAT family N-acetyltransferase [Streptomyces sp. 6N223]|uniref:GNAT family N-acetyltransferase n=1 Tax=Streptomyces sp. 6N223 TaxID=3457412 RepID=UPI003FD27CE0